MLNVTSLSGKRKGEFERASAEGRARMGKIVPIPSSFNAYHAGQDVTNAIQHVESC